MDTSALAGPIRLEMIGNGISVAIQKVFPYREDGTETTREDVMHALELERVTHGISDRAIDYWLRMARENSTVPERCIVAHFTPALRKGTEKLNLLVQSAAEPGDRPAWDIVHRYLSEFELGRPFYCTQPLCLVHEGQVIAKAEKVDTPSPGKNVQGDEIPVSRGQNIEFKAGEGVYLDHKTGQFSAGLCGYLIIRDFTLYVQEAVYITPDSMQMYFINLPRTDLTDHITDKELYNYCQRNQILFDNIGKINWDSFPPNSHVLISEGTKPGESADAELEIHFNLDKSIGEMDDHGRIDYKEQHKFNSIDADELLAVKKLPIRGEDGRDLYGKPIQAAMPKDIVFKQGRGTRVEKTDTEMKVFSAEEGVLEYEHNIVSVFPQITIRGDVGMETGHIESKANVEILGNVLAGFNVTSQKNVFVRGNIEDNCVISCGGDLNVIGGISGESTKIDCKGNFSAKYVETCTLTASGKMQVQRFLRGVKATCHDTIIVFGHGINLNERGAIVDCELRVRNELHVPVVGSDAGLKTSIWFGWDKALYDKIVQMATNLTKLEEQLAALGEGLPVDINNPNVYSEMQSLDRAAKDEVIARIQQKNKMEGRLGMMRKMYESEVAKRDDMLRKASVHISKKIIPDLILHCHEMQHTVDKIEGPSRYLFDMQSRLIERSVFGVASDTKEEEN